MAVPVLVGNGNLRWRGGCAGEVAGNSRSAHLAAGSVVATTARNVVKLRAGKRGGLMEMFRSRSGSVAQLQLTGTIAGKSTLSGSVSRSHGGTGRTFLPPIAGAAGVRIKLSSFLFTSNGLRYSRPRRRGCRWSR